MAVSATTVVFWVEDSRQAGAALQLNRAEQNPCDALQAQLTLAAPSTSKVPRHPLSTQKPLIPS